MGLAESRRAGAGCPVIASVRLISNCTPKPRPVAARWSSGQRQDFESSSLVNPAEQSSMARVAVLGTGLLGSAFVEGFFARGQADVAVWNRTRAKAEPLAAHGARVADTAADAVRDAELIHLVLLDD